MDGPGRLSGGNLLHDEMRATIVFPAAFVVFFAGRFHFTVTGGVKARGRNS
jgi:hypothetical protein